MTSTPDPPRLLFVQTLVRTIQQIERKLDAVLEPKDLSVSRLYILYVLLAARRPVPSGYVVQMCGCARSNVAAFLDRLRKDELVQSVPYTVGRSYYKITERGIDVYTAGIAAIASLERDMVGILSAGEREVLLGLLLQLSRAAGANDDDDKAKRTGTSVMKDRRSAAVASPSGEADAAGVG